jgi:glycosyltransferase involved in cell wall biosynthesis
MSEGSGPLVSMIVSCYNQARFVLETLESVKAQTYKHTELIIVDDCSTDDSVQIIDRWLGENRIDSTFIRHRQNQGVCKACNDGLRVANGKYISEIASDDVWMPDKIARQVEIMESQPADVGVLYSDALLIDEHGKDLPGMFIAAHRILPAPPQGHILDTLLEGNFIPGMTALIRRTCYDMVGLYDESLPWEDWDMWLRIARRFSFVYSPAPSAKYRIHPKSLSHNRMAIISGRACVYVKLLGWENWTKEQKRMLTRALAREYFRMACVDRQNGNRADALKHLVACVRTGKLQLPGAFIHWAAILGFTVFGIRRFRWWRG